MLEVATSTTPWPNSAWNRVPSSMASVMSETKNSSKQMTSVSPASLLAMSRRGSA
ncbi:hypothetical protein D3C75_1371000 [compost metagenome]